MAPVGQKIHEMCEEKSAKRVKNAPVIFRNKSFVFQHSTSPHKFRVFTDLSFLNLVLSTLWDLLIFVKSIKGKIKLSFLFDVLEPLLSDGQYLFSKCFIIFCADMCKRVLYIIIFLFAVSTYGRSNNNVAVNTCICSALRMCNTPLE
jgi:hypothetical protein